jgi:hypothetical protein
MLLPVTKVALQTSVICLMSSDAGCPSQQIQWALLSHHLAVCSPVQAGMDVTLHIADMATCRGLLGVLHEADASWQQHTVTGDMRIAAQFGCVKTADIGFCSLYVQPMGGYN